MSADVRRPDRLKDLATQRIVHPSDRRNRVKHHNAERFAPPTPGRHRAPEPAPVVAPLERVADPAEGLAIRTAVSVPLERPGEHTEVIRYEQGVLTHERLPSRSPGAALQAPTAGWTRAQRKLADALTALRARWVRS